MPLKNKKARQAQAQHAADSKFFESNFINTGIEKKLLMILTMLRAVTIVMVLTVRTDGQSVLRYWENIYLNYSS